MFLLKELCTVRWCVSLIELRIDCYYRNCILVVDSELNVCCVLRVADSGCVLHFLWYLGLVGCFMFVFLQSVKR